MDNKTIAAFDFDGTLTTKDTFLEFIRFAKGNAKAYFGFLLYAPMIALIYMRIMDNSRCKEILLSYFFKGMPYETFKELGSKFASRYAKIQNPATNVILRQHLDRGDKVYIVSASIDDWVRPIGMSLGVSDVLCTKMAVDAAGRLTGRFSTPNCYGKEKVRRLSAAEPDRVSYTLYAYGDSKGDDALLAFADHPTKIKS